MKVELLGTGTSQGVPVIGCDCSVCNSTDIRDKRLRCSALIKTELTTINIDIGPDFRYQMLRAGVDQLDAVLITHEHNDHVAGLDDIRPFNFKQKSSIDFYALPRVKKILEMKFDYVFRDKGYPGIPSINLHEINGQEISVKDVYIQPLKVYHGKLPIVGFKIDNFAYITDAKKLPDTTLEELMGIKVLVINALRREKHHSHMNLKQAIALGDRLQVDKLYLTHISHFMGCHEEVNKQLPQGVELAYDGLEIPF